MVLETEFTPLASLLGGVLVGISAVILMAGTGRISGVSGIVSRLLPPLGEPGALDRVAFLAGLLGAPLVYLFATGTAIEQTVSSNVVLLIIAGLLVGFGSVWGGRLHERPWSLWCRKIVNALATCDLGIYRRGHGCCVCRSPRDGGAVMSVFINLIAGIVFGLGLVIGGMVNPMKVLNFLDITGTWDPSLAFVLGGAVVTTAIGYRLVLARSKPLVGDSFQIPTIVHLDRKLVLGASMFGVGWGLVGYCPGPALTALSLLQWPTVVFVLAMLGGMFGARVLSR